MTGQRNLSSTGPVLHATPSAINLNSHVGQSPGTHSNSGQSLQALSCSCKLLLVFTVAEILALLVSPLLSIHRVHPSLACSPPTVVLLAKATPCRWRWCKVPPCTAPPQLLSPHCAPLGALHFSCFFVFFACCAPLCTLASPTIH
jgi:hypothetical protein